MMKEKIKKDRFDSTTIILDIDTKKYLITIESEGKNETTNHETNNLNISLVANKVGEYIKNKYSSSNISSIKKNTFTFDTICKYAQEQFDFYNKTLINIEIKPVQDNSKIIKLSDMITELRILQVLHGGQCNVRFDSKYESEYPISSIGVRISKDRTTIILSDKSQEELDNENNN